MSSLCTFIEASKYVGCNFHAQSSVGRNQGNTQQRRIHQQRTTNGRALDGIARALCAWWLHHEPSIGRWPDIWSMSAMMTMQWLVFSALHHVFRGNPHSSLLVGGSSVSKAFHTWADSWVETTNHVIPGPSKMGIMGAVSAGGGRLSPRNLEQSSCRILRTFWTPLAIPGLWEVKVFDHRTFTLNPWGLRVFRWNVSFTFLEAGVASMNAKPSPFAASVSLSRFFKQALVIVN